MARLTSSDRATSSNRQVPITSEIRKIARRLESRAAWKAAFISLVWCSDRASIRSSRRSSALRVFSRSGSSASLAPSRISRSVLARASA